MFQIKICGITSIEDAKAAAEAGADAIGLNFYARSPRHVSVETARQIIQAIPSEIIKVGLFVNSPADEAARIFDALGLDIIQLHGDEPPEYLAAVAPRPIMRAFRLGPEGLAPVLRYLDPCNLQHCRPDFVLFDALNWAVTAEQAKKPIGRPHKRICVKKLCRRWYWRVV